MHVTLSDWLDSTTSPKEKKKIKKKIKPEGVANSTVYYYYFHYLPLFLTPFKGLKRITKVSK